MGAWWLPAIVMQYHRPEVGAEGKAPACVLVTSGQGLGRSDDGAVDCSSLQSTLLQSSQFYPPTSLPYSDEAIYLIVTCIAL